tara:strand:- start:449 stop:1528 length:1080 start_codon:yes stop_codon:yes gene_type:complete
MAREYTSLGLMSGTSGDGIDASIIQTDGDGSFKVILDEYFPYENNLFKSIHELKDNINNSNDLNNLSNEIDQIEKKITIFHAEIIRKINYKKIDFVGFHGQTILHNAEEKISRQLGNGNLLSQLINKSVVHSFRQNDIKHGGQGAPLTPIFHKILVKKKKISLPVIILNIGGIANITCISKDNKISSFDIGPGNCLIDEWIRKNSKNRYDNEGSLARSGKINQIILNQSLDNFFNSNISKQKSYDIKDFDLSFVRGLSLEDGAATLTKFTTEIIANKNLNENILVCGGGRKNKFMIESLQKKINKKISLIDNFKINGDFIESQAFAYLAVRCYLNLPISFPETTGCSQPISGGLIARVK